MAQERRARLGGLTAAGALRRCRGAAARRRVRELQGREAAGARGISGAVSNRRAGRSSVEAVGGTRTRDGRSGAAYAGRTEPVEPGKRFVVGAAAARTGGGSGLRAHAGRPLSPHVPVSKM